MKISLKTITNLCVFVLTFNLIISALYEYELDQKNDSGYGMKSSINTLPKLSQNSSSFLHINGNLELEAESSSGNGSIENPYYISDIVYSSVNTTYGIYIQNTNKYLVITNCSVYITNYGIVLDNVTHVSLNISRVMGTEYALISYDSENIAFNNNIVNSNNHAITVQNSSNIILNNNDITISSVYGIFLNYSDSCVIENNFLNYNQNGIKLANSNYNRLINNNLEDHVDAVYLVRSNFSIIMDNHGINNLHEITENDCQDNYFSNNFQKVITNINMLDFTIIVLSCILLSSLVYVIKNIYHFKKLS